jgi:heterotetrameric sarcosine oxidase gamma subunit
MGQGEPTKLSPLFEMQKRSGATFAELAGWRMPEDYGDSEREQRAGREAVGLADESANGKILVEGELAASVMEDVLGLGAKAVLEGAVLAECTAYRLRPDHFFLSTSPGKDLALRRKLEVGSEGRFVTVTDMTHGWSEIRVLGPVGPGLISKVCGLDFDDAGFPEGTARQTSVAKTNQLVLRTNWGGQPSFSMLGARSLAAYLWKVLLEAGAEWDMVPVGMKALQAIGVKGE